MENVLQVRKLTEKYIDKLVDVVDEYREFCGFSRSYKETKEFLLYLLVEKKSTTFIAINSDDEVMGFINLYPSYSTLALRKIWILNDLAVSTKFRRLGVAQLLIKQGLLFAQETGAIRVELKTEKSNLGAQKLYSEIGFNIDNDNIYYRVPVK